jgi:hypothetical protein
VAPQKAISCHPNSITIILLQRYFSFRFFIGMMMCGFGFSLASCYEEKFTTDPADVVSFSTDTVSFDTVLTEISTVTRYFKVFNPHDLFITISES